MTKKKAKHLFQVVSCWKENELNLKSDHFQLDCMAFALPIMNN